MSDIKTLLILIPALPLAAAVLTAVLGPRVLRGRSHLPAVAALALSFVASMILVFQVQRAIDVQEPNPVGRPPTGFEKVVTLWTWSDIAGWGGSCTAAPEATVQLSPQRSPLSQRERGDSATFRIDVTLRADPLSAVMLAVVTCISTLVAIYSIGYMRGEPGYWRFFTYVSLFVFSMTMLVSASNFVLLYVFWEAVGLCSYLLIGFWYERPAAAAAGKKAFLVNRIGDVGLMLGIFLIWTTYGTLDFHDTVTQGVFGQTRLAAPETFAHGWQATAICLLLLLGACGKSAQFPLHVWLPDAMEGPTPVSALIHAATMVTAGVYLVARCSPLFAASPDARYAVAAIGGITALLGAVIAITQTDLKRILAYSTISHLGYMFLALGTGTLLGVTAGMFHLLTHAFFKALLFLGAGSVMHATGGVIDVRRLGGLRRRLPVTHWTFLIGCLAIAGVWPLAGFWSKDAILSAVLSSSAGGAQTLYRLLFLSATFGVLLIDFYMFRPYFLVFWGAERLPAEAGAHARESPGVMTFPLVVLAFGSAVVGAYFAWTGGFDRFLANTPSFMLPGTFPMTNIVGGTFQESAQENIGLLSTAITLLGIALAAFIYLGSPKKAARLARAMNALGLYSLSYGKFFFDPIYTLLIVRPLQGVARLAAWFDRRAIDALVDLCGRLPTTLGAALRPVQNGLIQFYALAMMLGLLALLGALLI
jgi:NADH-quinone oxidoreductase subunit L